MVHPVPWNDSATVVQMTFSVMDAERSPTIVFEGTLRNAVRFIKADEFGMTVRYRIALPDRHRPPYEYQGRALEALVASLR